jgi:2-polyprenyl-6-methoxyphenol hydroxylase-like FAD-dependent oxidoreductase
LSTKPTLARDDGHAGTTGSAIVVGASLAGLMSALTLARTGVEVTLLERSDDSGRTGAALHVEHDLLNRLTGRTRINRRDAIPAGLQTWHSVHDGLRAAAKADSRIRLLPNTIVDAAAQNHNDAWVTTRDGRTFRADIVIGADGHRSTIRRHVAPDKPHSEFAGYIIWIGIAQESELRARSWPDGVDFLSSTNGPLLGYPLPAKDGTLTPGRRQLGFAWYDATRNTLLHESGAIDGSVVQHSLTADQIPEETYRELAAEAEAEFPSPWRDAILDCVNRRSVIGTPISEYVPNNVANGRIALVGDAAHVPTPMTGSGFSASLHDAEALAKAVAAHGVNGPAAKLALATYERTRLADARRLVQSGQQFSRSLARGVAASTTA